MASSRAPAASLGSREQAAAGTGRVLNIPGTDAFRATNNLRIYSSAAVKPPSDSIDPTTAIDTGTKSPSDHLVKPAWIIVNISGLKVTKRPQGEAKQTQREAK